MVNLIFKLATLCLLACASLTSAETLVVDESNHRGWSFFAKPAVTAAGEAPVTGIADSLGGSASLNFTMSGAMGNKRYVKLRQQDFAAAGLTDITTLSDLKSISWHIHHSDPLTYPQFSVTLRAKPNLQIDGQMYTYKKYESLHFVRNNQRLNPSQWDTVAVDFTGRGGKGSKFRHSGPLDADSPINPNTHQNYTINQWIQLYGDLEIASIRWGYGNKNNAFEFTSYIDYLEINGTTFNFEGAPLQPPGPPTDVVATPGDGQVSVAFTAAVANTSAITRYEYQLGTQDGAGNWSEGNWTSTGGTSSPITIAGLTNGTDYRVGLRAVSNAGEGEESPVVIFAPRKATTAIGLTVQAGSPLGFSLAGFTSDYVKDRSAVGIADGLPGGNASINASLTGQGGDRWGLFLKPAQYKADVKTEEGGAYGGRKIDRLSDLTSLSFRVNHSGNGNYPKLGFQMARNDNSDDGKTIAQLNVDMSQVPPLGAGWNSVSIDFDETLFRSAYLSEGEKSEAKTLSEWIAEYGDRRINLVRWQTGSSGGKTTNTTYVDQIEVNGVTYDFEGLLPLPPSAPTDLVAAPGTEAGITFTFTPGDPGDSAIIDYQYSLNGDAGSIATWTSLGNLPSPYQFVVLSGLKNGREDTLFLRAVSNSGVGESATVAFRPRADLAPITMTVDSTDARGFYLSSASSDYVKERDQAGIPDKNGGNTKSLNASLSKSGDVWRAEIKAEDLNAGGRVLGKLHDIESLSYEVWHDAKGNYPQLSILIARLDGERAEALYLQVNKQSLGSTNAWNTVTVDPATSLFKNNNQNNSDDANAGETYTLNQWITFYGDRVVKRIRWGGTRSVPSETYLDFLEINGATYDFEAVPPAVIAPPPSIQSVTVGDKQVTVSFSAGDNAGATVLAYEYQVDEGEWTSTPDGDNVAPFTISGLTNGTTYTLTMRTLSAGLDDETLESEASDLVSFIPVGQPLPPTNLSAEVGDESAIVDFENTNTGNGAEITNYLVSLDGGPFVALDPAISSGPVTFTDLTNDQTYSVVLKTQTGSEGQALFSEPSDILEFTPESGASVPDAPTNVALTPGDQQLSVSFTSGSDNGSAITNYAYQINGGRWFDLNPTSTGNSFVIAGLENGETYSVSIRAINAEGYGANSDPKAATLLRPQFIIVTDDGKTIDLNITPESGSSCSIATAELVEAPALEGNVKSAYENMLDFTLENCKDEETVAVEITLSEDPPAEGMAYKYEYQNSLWSAIEGASINGRTISYDLIDNGPLDADPTLGKISDPVAVAVPSGKPEAPYDLVATPGNGTATVAFTAGDDGGNEITNYSYSTDGVTYSSLDPKKAASPIVIPDLINGKSFPITLKAQNSEGDSPASKRVVVTLSSSCADVLDWSTAASNDEWVCQIDGQEYEYADFHVLTVVEGDSTDICKSGLPINVNNQDNDAVFCQQSAGVVRAVFDWANRSHKPDDMGVRLSWLNTITQFGSRAQGNVPCGAAGETVAGRCANQLADGFRAFVDMAGPGGVAIVDLDIANLTSLNAMFVRARAFNENIGAWDTSAITDMGYMFNGAKSFNQDISGWKTGSVTRMKFMFLNAQSFNQPLTWDTSNVTTMASMFKNAGVFNQDISNWNTGNVTDMNAMFKQAKAFDQDLSGWNVTKVTDYSDFDTTTDAWCGLGFDNRGRPIGFSPTEAVGCLNVVLKAPESGSVGEEINYEVQYYNASTTPFDNGVLTLDIPSGISIIDAGEGAINGSQITWTNIEVPAGSSANGGGGELKVGATIGAGVTDGTKLIASATLSDGAATSINDVAGTIVSAKSLLSATLSFAETVLPGEVIEYALSVENVGQSPTEGGEITLTWEGDVPFTIEGNGGATCNGTSCRWVGELAPNDPRSQTVQVRIGVDATANATLTATLSASATNELETADSKASATTEILALPLPKLNVDVATQPQGVVDVGAQFTAFVDLSNTGSGSAGSTTVTLDIGSATYVGAAVGDAPSYDSNSNAVTWTVDNLDTAQVEVLSVRLQAPQAEGAVILKSEVSTTAAGNVITDSASRSLSVTGTAVLDLQLSLDPKDQLLPGDVLDMAFRFQNIGNAAAFEVVLATDTPVDTTLLAWPNYARCGADDCSEGYVGKISLELGTVEAKERETASLSVLVNETAEAQTLSVSGSLTGTNTVGDALVPQAAAASVLVAAITEDVLAVSQRADRQTAAPGQVVVYEITYQNLSSEAVTNVTLTDVLPTDTRLLNQTGGTVTIDPDTQETTWQLTTDLLAPLETGKVLLQVEVAGNAVLGTSLNNSVRLSTADSEVWADKAEVAVVANAAVLESSISNPEATAPGDSFTYALRFANTGTLAAGTTTLQLQVEDGVTVTDCDDCSKADGGRLSWSLSSIVAGTDQTKQITVLVDPSVAVNSELHAISYIGDTQNISAGVVGVGAKLQAQQQRRRGGSASVKQATSAAERGGPLGMSTIRVGEKASPALGGLKMIVPDQVVAGDQIAVTVSFGNTGDAAATGVTLTSKVPVNTTLTSVQGGSCSADPCVAGETLTWNVGEIAAESTREVSYILTADSDADGSVIDHRVVLNSAESREESVSAETDVVAEKLSVSIAVSDAAGNDAEGSIVSVGDTLTYTLTLLNESPAARSGITVVNQVPALIAACGQACIVGDSGGAAIDAEAGTLTWSNFTLDAGADVALDYEVTIPSGLENDTQLVNSVSVSTATRFYDSAQSTVKVAAQAELALSMTAPDVLQDGAQGGVTLSYQNTGTAATAATLRYVLPSNATMIDSANAAVSGSVYTWSLGDVAVDGVGSREVTIEVSGAADSRLRHTASVTGTDTSDTAEATTVIGLREALALSLTAPGSVNTDAGFTASLTAQNTGNAAANATALSLTLPAGFTASALDGGTLDSALGNQVVRWNVDLAAGASVTLSPTVTAPNAAGNATLLAGLTATSGTTQSASASVQVTMAPSAIVQAGAQFSVPEAEAGDAVTLTAGPVNIGGAASGAIANSITLAAGLSPTGNAGLEWNSTTRVLSWETPSLAVRGADLKAITLQVADAGALTATLTSNDASGTASIVRTFPEEVTITPENPDSSCKVSGQPVVAPAPTPPEGVKLAFANTVGFTVVDCDRNPNSTYPETMVVTIDVEVAIPEGTELYKVTDAGDWTVIEDAVIGVQSVTYSITDDGDLDLDKTPGILRDPVALAYPAGKLPVVPVPLPLWLLGLAAGLIGWLGVRRLKMA
ncbi:BspA family leucine-rich repeat surface protein [Luminiphilus sp. nBUS_07]|uniref:BspA family leucine-rich repeat surface protein n=1 Tax=Luminiphilus sp. nBUS_07 TaxID=3395314 RepID=UPI003EBE9985